MFPIELAEIEIVTSTSFGDSSAKYSINRWFVDHPETVLGRFEEKRGRHGDELTVVGGTVAEVTEELLCVAEVASAPASTVPALAPSTLTTGPLSDVQITAHNLYLIIKEVLAGREPQHKAQSAYRDFVATFGTLRSVFASGRLPHSRESALLLALETPQGRPSALLAELNIKPSALKIETLSGALLVSLNQKGVVDIELIAQLQRISPTVALDSLLAQGLVYEAPLGCVKPGLISAADYLTGDIGTKLNVAKQAAIHDNRFVRNVAALTQAMPAPLGPEDIVVGLGAEWVPPEVFRDWLFSLFPGETWGLTVAHFGGRWTITITNPSIHSASVGIATPRVGTVAVLEAALNNVMPVVFDTIQTVDGPRDVRNEPATMEAQARALELRSRFASWVFSLAVGKSGETGQARADRLCALYNERFNSIVPRDFSGNHLTFDGLATRINGKPYHLKPRQLRGVAKMLMGGTRDRSSYLVYPPGFGKTDPAIAGAVKLWQLGLCRKTLIAVPKSALEQWHHRFLAMFPSLADEVLCASDRVFGLGAGVGAGASGGLTTAQARQVFLARIATGGWHFVLVSHEHLREIVLTEETFNSFLGRELAELRMVLREAEHSSHANRDATKQARRSLRSRESALQRASVAHKKRWAALCDGGKSPVSWEDCGIDHLILDEAHAFKNLAITTRMERIAGLPTGDGSSRAYDCFVKCQTVLRGGGQVTALSGTPLTNTVCEAFVWLRMLQPALLAHLGLATFDSFASVFTEAYPSVELDCVGKYRTQTRLRFHNVPELLSLLSEAWDFVREREA